MSEDRERERQERMIEAAVRSAGFQVEDWRKDDDYEPPRAVGIVGRFRVIEDDEDCGLYSGDEGVLEAEVVGAQSHRNERVAFAFTAEGTDSGLDVRDLGALEPA